MRKKHSEQPIKRGDSSLALKSGAWYVTSNFLVRAIAFITTPIFARLMTKAEYGEFSNFASWQAILLIITGAELYNTVNRAYYDYKEEHDSYISAVSLLGCAITVVFYVIFLLLGDTVYKVIAIPPEYIHLLFIVLLFQTFKQVYFARERTMYRYKSVALLSVLNLAIPTLIAVGLVVVLPEGSDRLAARMYGFYLPSAVIGAICAVPLLRGIRGIKWAYLKYALALSLPLLAHYLSAYLLTSANTILTKSLLGAEMAAVVSISSSVLHLMTVLFHSVSGALQTWLMDNLEQKRYAKVRKESMFYVILLSVVAIGVILLTPEVVKILGGAKYMDAIWLIPGLILAIYLQAVSTLFTITLTYDKNVKKTALFAGIVSVISILAKIWLLPIFGYIVLPYTNIAAFGSLFVINYILVCRAGYRESVNMKGMLLGIAAVCAALLSTFVLYGHTLARYGVILACLLAAAGIGLKYKEMIRSFLERRKKNKKKIENTAEEEL